MTIAYFTGFETGDTYEFASPGGATIQRDVVRSGGFAAMMTSTPTLVTGLNSIYTSIRLYLQTPTTLGGPAWLYEASSLALRLQFAFRATLPVLRVIDSTGAWGLTQQNGTTNLNPNQWYRIDISLDCNPGGRFRLWIDGVIEFDTTHTADLTASPTDGLYPSGAAAPLQSYLDDVRVDIGTTGGPIGPGRVIARQGKVGTPFYDQWTKTNRATAWEAWSDSPLGFQVYCSSPTVLQEQTMRVAPFSQPQKNFGTTVLKSTDYVNAAKVMVIAFATGPSSSLGIIHRFNGIDVLDSALVGNGAILLYQTPSISFFGGIPVSFDNYEIGGQNLSINTMVIYGAWLCIEYTEANYLPLGQAIL